MQISKHGLNDKYFYIENQEKLLDILNKKKPIRIHYL